MSRFVRVVVVAILSVTLTIPYQVFADGEPPTISASEALQTIDQIPLPGAQTTSDATDSQPRPQDFAVNPSVPSPSQDSAPTPIAERPASASDAQPADSTKPPVQNEVNAQLSPSPVALQASGATQGETSTQYAGLVVTQVQTSGGSGRTGEELIEIRNNSSHDIDITGWSVQFEGATLFTFISEETTPGHYVVLPAGKTAVIATSAFVSAHVTVNQAGESVPFATDGIFANGKITNANGSVRVVNASGAVVSGVAWGAGTPSDGTPFPALSSSGGVIERKLLSDGWHQDTRINSEDFKTGQLRENYIVGQIEDVFDACLNIEGISTGIPDGWQRDDKTGMCSERPVPVALHDCEGVLLSEVAANVTGQFIEIYNSNETETPIGGCGVMTNRNKEKLTFSSTDTMRSHEYRAIYIRDTPLTLTKTTTGIVYLIAENGIDEVDSVQYQNLSADTSWSYIKNGWQESYALTPSAANVAAPYRACETGYVRNELTGRCNKVTTVAVPTPCKDGQYRSEETGRCRLIALAGSTLTPCKEGQYRSEETNRCRSLATTASLVKPCNDDQFRNPATGRCKKIASTDDMLQPCDSGYERNPATNRCRKIVASIPDAASIPFPVEPVADSAKVFAAWWALGGVLLAGSAYAAWEWRRELTALLHGVLSRKSRP
jgi:hypothetical protein